MDFTFRVRFTGLCTFVHDSGDKKMLVLMVDCREDLRATDRRYIHACPCLLFDREDLDAANIQSPDFVFEGVRAAGKDSMIFLDHEDLGISVVGGTIVSPTTNGMGTLEVNEQTISDPINPRSANRDSWLWIANLKEFNGFAGLRAGWSDADPTGAGFAARFDIDAGYFCTEEFLRPLPKGIGTPRPVQIVEFESGTGRVGGERAIAMVATLRLHLSAGSKIQIARTSWDGQARDPLVLDPKDSDLSIEVWNTPFKDFADTWGTGWPEPYFDYQLGDSFLHHYRSLDSATTEPLPRRVEKVSNSLLDVRIEGKETGCMPTRTSEDF